MSKITYANKQALNENTSIADINKVKASDLNEIKAVVNQNDDNTTTNTTEISTINNKIGDLNNLETTDKTSIVNAINEVVESGSNDNGSYVKYADGTMTCYGTWNIGAVSASAQAGNVYKALIEQRHNFPVSFIEKPTITFSAYENVEDWGMLLVVCPKKNSVTSQNFGSLNVISATQAAINLAIDYIAIGKWK